MNSTALYNPSKLIYTQNHNLSMELSNSINNNKVLKIKKFDDYNDSAKITLPPISSIINSPEINSDHSITDEEKVSFKKSPSITKKNSPILNKSNNIGHYIPNNIQQNNLSNFATTPVATPLASSHTSIPIGQTLQDAQQQPAYYYVVSAGQQQPLPVGLQVEPQMTLVQQQQQQQQFVPYPVMVRLPNSNESQQILQTIIPPQAQQDFNNKIGGYTLLNTQVIENPNNQPIMHTQTLGPQSNNIVDPNLMKRGTGMIALPNTVQSNLSLAVRLRKQCPVCDKICSRPSTLKTHYLIHTGDTPFKCPWKSCKKSFNVKSNMLRHYKSHQKKSFKVELKPVESQDTTVTKESTTSDNNVEENKNMTLNASE